MEVKTASSPIHNYNEELHANQTSSTISHKANNLVRHQRQPHSKIRTILTKIRCSHHSLSPPLSLQFLSTPLSSRTPPLLKNERSPMVQLEPHHRRRTRRTPPQIGPPSPISNPNFRRNFKIRISRARTCSFLRQTRGITLQTKLTRRVR